jgi:hypothetical protein
MFNHYRSEVQYRDAANVMAKILCMLDVHFAEKLTKKENMTYEEAIKYVRYVRAKHRIDRRIDMGLNIDGVAPWVFSAIEEY